MVGQNKPVQSPLLVAAARFRKRASQRGTNQWFRYTKENGGNHGFN
jgi:hypothetical protein